MCVCVCVCVCARACKQANQLGTAYIGSVLFPYISFIKTHSLHTRFGNAGFFVCVCVCVQATQLGTAFIGNVILQAPVALRTSELAAWDDVLAVGVIVSLWVSLSSSAWVVAGDLLYEIQRWQRRTMC